MYRGIKIIFVTILILITAGCASLKSQGLLNKEDKRYLKSNEASHLAIPSDLKADNITNYYEIPSVSASVSGPVSVVPPELAKKKSSQDDVKKS